MRWGKRGKNVDEAFFGLRDVLVSLNLGHFTFWNYTLLTTIISLPNLFKIKSGDDSDLFSEVREGFWNRKKAKNMFFCESAILRGKRNRMKVFLHTPFYFKILKNLSLNYICSQTFLVLRRNQQGNVYFEIFPLHAQKTHAQKYHSNSRSLCYPFSFIHFSWRKIHFTYVWKDLNFSPWVKNEQFEVAQIPNR